MLKLMYITKRPEIAQIAEKAGVDWIFVDMEFFGKDARQGGLNTVQNHHTIEDIAKIKSVVKTSKVIVRVNPIHDALPKFFSSEDEINASIEAGADIIMLPFFKTVAEVRKFLSIVNRRVKSCLLVETPEAAEILDQIVEIPGIDMIHLGLNDMHLALGMKFMFQLLADGSVDRWSSIIKSKGIQFGFGGLASLEGGAIQGNMILKEHFRLGSQQVIVSRAFCNTDKMSNLDEVRTIFNNGISAIRSLEAVLATIPTEEYDLNHKAVCAAVDKIVNK